MKTQERFEEKFCEIIPEGEWAGHYYLKSNLKIDEILAFIEQEKSPLLERVGEELAKNSYFDGNFGIASIGIDSVRDILSSLKETK